MSVSEPGKIITPWAESGLKNTIPPAANPATGRAGFDQGFSAINMTAKEAGGIPPFGQDFNGIFYEVTNILRYMQAGGQPTFSSALATSIGGYPKGAMVLGSDGVTLWQSKVDSNSTDPNIDPSNWGTFDIGLKADLADSGGGNIPGWYDAAAEVRAFNSKTETNTWQDAVSIARGFTGENKPVVIGANASGVETVAIQYALPSGVTGYHLSQGTTAAPSTDKRPLILLEKVCDSGITFGPHSMANFSMKYVGGTDGAIPLSTYVEATGSSAGGAIGIQTRARILSPTASGWGGWSYVDVAGNLPVRAIGHEINVRCNLPAPLTWSASGGVVDGLVIATVDNGSNNMANSAIKISRSSQGQGFLTGIRIGYKTILPSDTTDLSVLNGEAFLINGGSSDAERYGGIRLGANDGAGFTRFHYGIRLNEAQFNNGVAIWLGDNQRIRWGSALNSGPYITCTGSEHQAVGAPLNIANGAASALRTGGSKVVGTRVTGFARMTGTPLKTSFNADTATLTQVAQRLKAIEDALHADSGHGLYGLT